jgi:hypothetical protein
MDNKLKYINMYKNMIINESYEFIINEMLSDLKQILLNMNDDVEFNYNVLETFHNIDAGNSIEKLNQLENILTENTLSISKIKSSLWSVAL